MGTSTFLFSDIEHAVRALEQAIAFTREGENG